MELYSSKQQKVELRDKSWILNQIRHRQVANVAKVIKLHHVVEEDEEKVVVVQVPTTSWML